MSLWESLPGFVHSLVWILAVTITLILTVAYLTLWERKLIGWMQMRKGPNRVRIFGLPYTPGLGQPFADVIKLLIKEVVVPLRANGVLFRLAPAITLIPARRGRPSRTDPHAVAPGRDRARRPACDRRTAPVRSARPSRCTAPSRSSASST